MGDVDPKLADLTDRVLYGDIWERPELSKRDRSLITVAALIALNRPDQLRSHMALALKNGVTQAELTETVTQMAFYAGWPSAVAAVPLLAGGHPGAMRTWRARWSARPRERELTGCSNLLLQPKARGQIFIP